MRTTIEITDEQRARLLEIAARRGERGFSGVVRQAIDRYLEAEAMDAGLLRAALATRGSLSDGEADVLEAEARELRESWR